MWAAHVALDWDFELPAATLPALLAAGALLALAEDAYSASATRGASRRKTQTATTQMAT